MIDYLFYKLFRASQRSSIPEVAGLFAAIILTICLSFNFLTIIGLLKKTNVINYFPSKDEYIYVAIGIFVLISLMFFIKSRYKRILEKYQQENTASKHKGRLFVALYVILSFATLIGTAFFRPETLLLTNANL